MNRSGIHDIPHQAGPKGIIQYCEAIPAMNKTKKILLMEQMNLCGIRVRIAVRLLMLK